MTVSIRTSLITITVCAVTAWGQPNQRTPHIGYIYPSGGQRGTTFQIIVGGQYLRGVSDVHVSGKGVRAKVIKHYRPVFNIDKEQRQALIKRLKELRDERLEQWPRRDRGTRRAVNKTVKQNNGKFKINSKQNKKQKSNEELAAKLPEHPAVRNLEKMNLRELRHVAYEVFFPKTKKQLNAQIAESVLIEVTIASNAVPGDRELRLETPLGLTNPMVFQVGELSEISELEPNEPQNLTQLQYPPPLDLPVLLNGRIMPGDVDHFRFRAQQGQQLVVKAYARRLIPYLADAVPGWFQATLTLYDSKGNEVAFADDYRFDPDPIIFYKVPNNGVYELEIRDSIYRGREDFVYRVAIDEQPFVTQAFPLGGRRGIRTISAVDGWNLNRTKMLLDTKYKDDSIRHKVLQDKKGRSNEVTYAVDSLSECQETEPNNTIKDAQQISMPRIVNGRIAQPGDVDVFQFRGRSGSELIAEVCARRLHSPLDSLLRITDADGHILEWNDDHQDPEIGLLTHHADSYLHARLPGNGTYYVHVSDAQHHGGQAYGYRLRLSEPRSDYALRMIPSSINVPAGRSAVVCVYALRKDGFKGEIEVYLKNAPDGFTLNGGRIPPGRERVHMTLTVPSKPLDAPVTLQLEGRARIGRRTIRRQVVPAEDVMQAFIYRHLVPSQELMVSVLRAKAKAQPVELASNVPVQIPPGGTARVWFRTQRRARMRQIKFELREPPKGISLQDAKALDKGLTLVLKVDEGTAQIGLADNLIVEAYTEWVVRQKDGKKTDKKQRVSLGVLPAIPFEIVHR